MCGANMVREMTVEAAAVRDKCCPRTFSVVEETEWPPSVE